MLYSSRNGVWREDLFVIVPLPVSTILDAPGRDFVVFTSLTAMLCADRVVDEIQNEVGKS